MKHLGSSLKMASLIDKISKPVLGSGSSLTPRLPRGLHEGPSTQSSSVIPKIKSTAVTKDKTGSKSVISEKPQKEPKRSASPFASNKSQDRKKVDNQLKKTLESFAVKHPKKDNIAKALSATQPVKKMEEMVKRKEIDIAARKIQKWYRKSRPENPVQVPPVKQATAERQVKTAKPVLEHRAVPKRNGKTSVPRDKKAPIRGKIQHDQETQTSDVPLLNLLANADQDTVAFIEAMYKGYQVYKEAVHKSNVSS